MSKARNSRGSSVKSSFTNSHINHLVKEGMYQGANIVIYREVNSIKAAEGESEKHTQLNSKKDP